MNREDQRLPIGVFILLAVTTAIAAVVVALVSFTEHSAGSADHDAADFFIFSKASYGTNPIQNETNCDVTNDSQVELPGSNSDFFGRIHSNADIKAFSGSGNEHFDTAAISNPEITYGTHDEDCIEQSEITNTYNAGGPTDIDTLAPGVSPGAPGTQDDWPGNLATFLNVDGITFSNVITQVLPGETCDVGTLTTSTAYDIQVPADDGNVICSGSGEVRLLTSGAGSVANPFDITIVCHCEIIINGQDAHIAPAAHGVLAWSDIDGNSKNPAIVLSGSDMSILHRSILFAPRSGIDVPGSDDSTLCIQVIGQGRNKVQGQHSTFGPVAPGCIQPPTPTPTPTPTPGDSDGDGIPDPIEELVGGEGINVPAPGQVTCAGLLPDGSIRICVRDPNTGQEIVVTLSPGTQVQGGGSNKIEIKFASGPLPKLEFQNIQMPLGQTKTAEMPIGSSSLVCIEDKDGATIETVSQGACPPPPSDPNVCPSAKFALQIPTTVNDSTSVSTRSLSPECTPTTYIITRINNTTIEIEGLVQ